MFGAQYYHGLIRKYVVAFGNLFDDLVLQRLDREGNRIQSIGVPLAYGPKEKFLQRLTQDPNLDSQVAITLPRMGFEINAFTYAPTRKLSSTHRHWAGINGVTDKLRSSYVPVPYDIGFTLSIFVANADDGAQLLEQIVPYFRPEYTTNVLLIPDLGISVDTPFVLQDIALQDTYEGEFQTRRALTFDLNFLCKGYLFGPVEEQGLITQVINRYYDGEPGDADLLQTLTYYANNGVILETAIGDLETIGSDGVSESAVAQNLWYALRGNTGNTYPKTPTSQLNVLGGTDISTTVDGNTITIDYIGVGGGGGGANVFVFTTDGNYRNLTGFIEDSVEYSVRSTEITGGGLFRLELASFTPGLSATGQPATTLNWDVPVTGFTVVVDNPTDFTTKYISDVNAIAQLSGLFYNNINYYDTTGKTATPAGGVDWNQPFTVNGTAQIRSTSTTIAGGSASGRISFKEKQGALEFVHPSTVTLTFNWNTPTVATTFTNQSGATFLQSYNSTPYNVTVTGISNLGNISHAISSTAGGSISNASGSGTFTFTSPIHKTNAGTSVGITNTTTFNRPAGVAATSYSVDLVSGDTSITFSFTYPSFWLWTVGVASPPARADIINGTGFESGVTVLGNQAKTFSGYVNNTELVPRAFWFGVRAAASQPTNFQTGASPSLLSPVSYTQSSVGLAPDSPPAGYANETYSLYGIVLQPGSTYVSIS